jgi:hypothetical protein
MYYVHSTYDSTIRGSTDKRFWQEKEYFKYLLKKLCKN